MITCEMEILEPFVLYTIKLNAEILKSECKD